MQSMEFYYIFSQNLKSLFRLYFKNLKILLHKNFRFYVQDNAIQIN